VTRFDEQPHAGAASAATRHIRSNTDFNTSASRIRHDHASTMPSKRTPNAGKTARWYGRALRKRCVEVCHRAASRFVG
jgi:hypothetical protein